MKRTAHEHELSDAELVERARGGVPTAFGVLVTRYQDRVYNTCYRMCHNHADALDLTQATFIKALEALERFESRANFYTWLFRIAMNLTISSRRTAARRPTRTLEAPTGAQRPIDPPSHEPDVSQPAEQRELQARVAAALARLDDDFRAAVVLKDIEGLDYSQIAEILGVPVGTVKSRIHRGRLVLRDLLADERLSLGRP